MRCATLYWALLFALLPATARAEGAGPSTAEALFREGRRAADDGNYAVACPKFEESYRLDPAPGALLNLGDCEENRGQLARAWQHFRQLHDQLPPTDDRKAIAEARARAVELRAPKLRVMLIATGPAVVTRDDIVLGRASLGTSVPVDPGRHLIVVTAMGRRDRRYEVSLGEREDRDVSVSSGEPLPEATRPLAATVPAPQEATQAPAREGRTQRTAAFALGGVGIASLTTGAFLGAVALSHIASSGCAGNVCSNRDAPSELHGVKAVAIAADITVGLGVSLIGAAVVLALTGHRTTGTRATSSVPAWIGGRF
jgi:hypothetical protein